MEEENREEEGGGSQGKKSLTKSVASPQEASNVVNPEADYLSEKSEVKKPKGENTSLGVSEYTLKNLKSSTPEQPEPEAVKKKTFSTTQSSYKSAPKVSLKTTEEPQPASETRAASEARGGSLSVFRSIVPGENVQSFANNFLQKRSPFIHNPPQPEERRARIPAPRTPREYIINLREDLADFQESHGLPRTRDYSFVSLGLALAQETGRAIYSLFQMFIELFPIVAIVSLILRFALDKLIEILETSEPVPKIKKSIIFALEMIAIVIPLWILIGTIVFPLISLIFSIFRKVVRFKGGKKKAAARLKPKPCS